jgi:small subunit ribosomal protein S14
MTSKHAKKRDALKEKMSVNSTPEERIEAMKKMAGLPRNANKTRLHNRCSITGRSRSYIRQFGLCRQQMRQLASEGKLPGVRKSSW